MKTVGTQYQRDDAALSYRSEQALRAEHTALIALTRVRECWRLQNTKYHNMLSWAARCYETGLTIAHSQYHKHSAYLLRNSDLPGFTKVEQTQLASVVQGHRRKFSDGGFNTLPTHQVEAFRRLTLLLRLAIVLHCSRSKERLPPFKLTANTNQIALSFPRGWLDYHPLTYPDQEQEACYLKNAGYILNIS